MDKQNFFNLSRAFFLIFIAAMGLRLWHITNPLLDEHHWRQTGSAIVARNYMVDHNFFRPAQDLDEPYPMAYGLFEYMVGMIAIVTGFSDLLGRLSALFFFIIGFVYFYKLIRRFFDESTALWSCAFYAFLPTGVFYTRAFQPDGSMVAMTIVFLYYFTLWVDEGKWNDYFLSIIFANLAFLFKIPSLFMMIPAFGYLLINKGLKAFLDWRWYVFGVLSSAFPIFFHLYVPVATHGRIMSALFQQDKWSTSSYLMSGYFWWERFIIDLSEYQLTHAGYILFFLGLFKKVTDKRQWVFHLWILGFFLFTLSASKGMTHEYYWVPLIPPASFFIGWFVSDFFRAWKEKWARSGIRRFGLCLVSFMVFSSVVFSLIRLHDRYKVSMNYKDVSDAIIAVTKADDKILVMDRAELEVIYYSHRHGSHIRTIAELKELVSGGAVKGFTIDKFPVFAITDFDIRKDAPDIFDALKSRYKILYDTPSGIVFRIKETV